MLYKNLSSNEYYLLMQSSISSSTLKVDYHIRRITDGLDVILSEEQLNSEYIRAEIKEALNDFYEAQWIGEANLEKMTIAMMQEVSEAFNELDWKPWKTKEPNLEAYREELADVGIFLLLCSKVAGMSFEDLMLQMIQKHLYNLSRKDHKPRK